MKSDKPFLERYFYDPTLLQKGLIFALCQIRTLEEEQQHQILEAVLSLPLTPCPLVDAPPLRFRGDMAVLISEETPDAAAWGVTCASHAFPHRLAIMLTWPGTQIAASLERTARTYMCSSRRRRFGCSSSCSGTASRPKSRSRS